MYIARFEGEMEKGWGKSLTSLKRKDGSDNTVASVSYKGTYEAYGIDKDEKAYLEADWDAAIVEMRDKNEFPTNKEIVKFANAKRLAAAKAAQTTKELAKLELVQPTTANDVQLRLKKVFDMYWDNMDAAVKLADPEAAKANARAEAAAFLKAEWAD